MSEKRKKKAEPIREEREPTASVPVRILTAILCFGLSVLVIYMAIAVPSEGTAMQNVQNVIRGISGNIPIVLSLIFIWVGILLIGSARGKKVKVFHVIAYAFMFLSIFAAVHIFKAREIIDELNVNSYPQFIMTSYAKRMGGGILGSFFSYFLYNYVGDIAGCAVCVLFVFLSLVATGRASKIFDWSKNKAAENRKRRDEREERRREENKHIFDDFSENRAPRGRGTAPAPRRRSPEQQAKMRQARRTSERVSDPSREIMYIPNRGDVDQDRRRAATQAFYDPEADEELPPTRKRGRNTGIEVPRPIAELREDRKEKKPRSRFADPNSVRREPAAKEKKETSQAAQDSSVSAEAMSVVAETIRKENKKPVPEKIERAESEEATEQDIDEIFSINEEPEAEIPFEPIAYERPAKKEPAQDIGVFGSGISREKGKSTKKATFVETDSQEYNYPPIDLLERGDKDKKYQEHENADLDKAEILRGTLASFGIETNLSGIAHGPAVTRFELQPKAGIKLSRITSLSDDIAMALAAESVRIEAPIPGKNAVGVEIPNDKVETVRLRDVLESSEALHNTSKVAVGLGKDNSGRYVVTDIAKMPHVLIAGQTGSGKSVCINSIITSILYRSAPEDVRMILIDPKVVELQVYNDIPHLIAPVVTDPKKASSALQWAVTEMLDRYKQFSAKGVRNIKGYNAALKADEKKMPQIVIIIDELADLMMAAPGEVEDSICRIAQLARAAGMHLVIATQRPSVNVITGIIKANIPTRIAFAVASQMDSRVMIDHGGAEKLLGNGDMLFVPNGGKTLRVQGTWVSDEEVESVVSYIKDHSDPNYDEDVQEKIENSIKSDAEIEESNEEQDDRLAEAVEIVVEAGQASVSMLQRRMRVGYARAGRLIDEMQKRGIVSEADGAKPRNVLMTREQFREAFADDPAEDD